MADVSLFSAFIAGVVSFVSPGVLPLIPGYLAFISGVSLEGMRAVTVSSGVNAAAKRRVIVSSLFFSLGFSLVFVFLGAPASAAGQFMLRQSTLFGKIAGVLLIVFGLHTIGVFRIPFLPNEARAHSNTRPAGMIVAVVVGVSFAFGWIPSIGPILAAILAVASQQDSINHGIVLLSVYSLGLAIPFLLTALAINRFVAFSRLRRHDRKIEIVSGLLMIAIGVLIFTNRFPEVFSGIWHLATGY